EWSCSGRCRWTVGIGLEAFALSRVPEPWWRTLHWSYLGAGAQGPQASITSRTKQLEHSLFISWINLLSRVSKSYREGGGGVKGEVSEGWTVDSFQFSVVSCQLLDGSCGMEVAES